MQNNERINRNKEKKRIKDNKIKTIVWVILGLILAALLIMKICEIDFNDVKNRFTSASSITASNEEIYPYSLDSSGNCDVAILNNKLAVLTDTSLSVINPTDAKSLNKFDHGYTDPYFEVSGNYTLLFDRGGTRFRVDTVNKNLFEKMVDRNIITATISKNGTVAYSSFCDNADCKLVVMTKNENVKLELPVKHGYITAIALNSSGTKCTYVTVESKDAVLISTVHTMNISSPDDASEVSFNNSNILSVKYSNQGDVYIVGDDFLSTISNRKKYNTVFEKGTISTNMFCYNADNELIINYREYTNSTDSKLAFVRSNGKVKTTIELDTTPKFISASSNELTALFANEIDVYSLTKGEVKEKIEADNSVNSVYTLGSKHYLQYGQYIDVK